MLVLLLALLLAACGSSDDDELHHYINEIKVRPAKPVEPIPEFKAPVKFSYPEDTNRRSPFKPMAPVQHVDIYAPDKNRQKQPLEAFPLDALKFVGLLQEGNTIWALVSQPSGFVSRVKAGNYMGMNYGQILKISDKGIEIEETVQGSAGWEKKRITVKMNTPPAK